MHAVCEGFDDFFAAWNQDVYRLCFAMTENAKDACNLTFKNFLRLGAAKDPQMKEKDAKFLLFSSGFTLCVDYFGRKMRHRPDRKALDAMNLPFPITDNLCALLKHPLKLRGTLLNVFMTLICAYPLARRGALCLAQSGFSEDEIAKIAGRSAAQFACASTPEAASAREAVSSIVFAEDDADAMNDEIYARFEERSVGVENKIHDIRIRFDQIAPYLALAVLAIFAVAVYVSFKMAG